MKIDLVKVGIEDKNKLSDLLDVYRQELSKFRKSDENKGPYKYLDNYFSEPNRYPFFITVDRNIAGLVLVNLKDPLSDQNKQTIAEFYIVLKYRNKGIGTIAAQKIFDMFPGEWIVRELDGNPSEDFWKKVINQYTKGNYIEREQNDEKWKGKVQEFDNLA